MLNSLFLLLLTSLSYSQETNYFELFEGLEELGQAAEKTGLRQCPGLKLVVSCGNQVCENYLNETPENCPADCIEAPIRSYNHQVICQNVKEIKVPTTVYEVQDIIKEAIIKKMKVRPVGALHSASEAICTEGIVVPMGQLNAIKGISEVNGQKVVEAESGITVFELSEWLYEKGHALAGVPNMGFRDLTIGGAVATASHGSSPSHAGVISNIIEAIEFIDGLGEHHYFERHSTPELYFKALTANLGLLGIVTSLKLAIQPRFNIEVKVSYHSEKKLLKKGIFAPVKGCDYGQLNWFPGRKSFMLTCGKKTSKTPDMGANNVLLEPAVPSFATNTLKKILQLGACSKGVMCLAESARYTMLKLNPPFKNHKGRTRRKLVGPVHRMTSSHLTKAQQGFFQMDWEIAVPASRANEALKFIKKHFTNNRTCLPLVGIFIRYAPSENRSWLAHTVSSGGDWKEGETAVFFEAPVYLPVGMTPQQMASYEKVFLDFTRELITKFSGRPHWGKNRQWAFDLAVALDSYGENLGHFKKSVKRFDPNGVFINEFGRRLGI